MSAPAVTDLVVEPAPGGGGFQTVCRCGVVVEAVRAADVRAILVVHWLFDEVHAVFLRSAVAS